ncbi:ATP-binding protein [Sphingobacterium shayense]|uniref:ATP-binding protein n=1 Tax=Sphingobacterium shayense TaxID=626343 RepID=UPI001551A80F|nr:ATP-binding protein [Sphingobacterium shayense]NQD70177.1 ATP-binding protein [Sphingobacterium shayense]
MKEVIKEILIQNQERNLAKGLRMRYTGISLDLEKIQAIIGPRRVGKTSAMQLAIEELKTLRGVSAEYIIYFNFEDERIQFEPHQLDLILQAWQELNPENELKNAWFFFDEVQAAPGWERFLNRINETISKRIFFTGSNSSVLHTELKSVLRGRSIAIELLPLSFKEYCEFSNIEPSEYGLAKSKTIALFHQYLVRGGYPETINLPSQQISIAYLQEYYNAMLLRDIIEYNQLSNYSYLRSLYRQAASTIGKIVSTRRLHNHLKSQQYSVGINSVYEAMDIAEQAYLFKRISRFDYSDSKREKSDKKIYWLDNGLLNANTAQYTGNNGLLLENLIFKELYLKFGSIYTNNIYYYADASGECDFVVYQEGGVALPVQVSWTLTDSDTRKREIKGLLNAAAYCKAETGWIITLDEEEKLTIDGVEVKIMPAWKWLLRS